MSVNFKSLDSLDPVIKVVNEASLALNDEKRIISDSPISETLVAALGAGAGGGIGFAGLWGLGVTGLSAAGLTSGLAAAGSLIGGGMAAGVAVLAAPAVLLSVAGYGAMSHFKKKKLIAKKQELYKKALEKQNAIINMLKNKYNLSKERIDYLTSLNTLLTNALKDLQSDLQNVS